MRMISKAGLLMAATSIFLTAAHAQQPAQDAMIPDAASGSDTNLLIPAYVPTPPPRPANLAGDAMRVRERKQSVELARSDFSGAGTPGLVERRASTLQSKVWMTIGTGF